MQGQLQFLALDFIGAVVVSRYFALTYAEMGAMFFPESGGMVFATLATRTDPFVGFFIGGFWANWIFPLVFSVIPI
ncbi:hypothetical protein D0O09_32565 [Pseudomonas putida]|nr:hypothetical protein D0O09_32565 [Pseudomonas putida]